MTSTGPLPPRRSAADSAGRSAPSSGGRVKSRGRLADQRGGHALRVVAAGRKAAQHGVEPGADGGRGAERRQQQQAAAGGGRALASLMRVRPAFTALAEGAETRIRRSLSDSPPPSAISAPPSQIQGASGLWCSRMHRAAVALLAQHGIEVGDPGGVDRRLAGGHAVDREIALVRLQHGDQAGAVAHFQGRAAGGPVGALARCGCRSGGTPARPGSSPRPASAARAGRSPAPCRPGPGSSRRARHAPAPRPRRRAAGRGRATRPPCGRLNSAMRSATSASAAAMTQSAAAKPSAGPIR